MCVSDRGRVLYVIYKCQWKILIILKYIMLLEYYIYISFVYNSSQRAPCSLLANNI